MNQRSGLVLTEKTYQDNGVYVSYPQAVSDTGKSRTDLINGIILADINRFLNLYSKDVIAPPAAGSGLFLRDTLHIGYEIMRNDDRILSIFYTADFYSPYAPHPTQLIFSTNIDLINNRRLKLSDILQVDDVLPDEFLFWEPVGNGQYINEIRDYIRGLGKEVLRSGFGSADIIGSMNRLGIFSYLKPNRIGISISVPNYLGDHAEFEKNLQL